MAHVNLLPHRAAKRKEREREFYMQLVAAFVVALGVLLIWMFWMGQRIDNQNDRNTLLQTEIKQLDVRIAKIKDLEKVREHLLARKQIIEQLQADRSQMVHLFDELVRTIPSSARLTGLKQNGQSMALDGFAESNASVAEYMRNIEDSPWMGHADLRKTENSHNSTRLPYIFGLDVALSRPKTDEAGAMDTPATASSGATPVSATVSPATPGTATAGTAAKAASTVPTQSVSQPAAASLPKPKAKTPTATTTATGGTNP